MQFFFRIFVPDKWTTMMKRAWKEGVLPLAGMFAITAALVVVFYTCLGIGENMEPVFPVHVDDGESVDPNPMRLAFMLTGFLFSFFLAAWAEKKGASGKTWPAFWLGYTGGTLIWQSVGECSWHFGLSGTDYLVCFAHLESSASLFLVIMTTVLLVYCAKKNALGWGVWVFVLTFVGNWFGHFIQIGTYPIVCHLMEEDAWFRITGASVGIPVCLAALFLNFKYAETEREYLLCSLFLYFGIGIIVTGVAGL